MKTSTVNLRVSEADEATLKQAAENLSILTDKKPSLSETIREGVKILAEQDPTAPILFHVNRQALRDLEKNLSYGQTYLQKIYDEYVSAVGSVPAMEEIISWFGDRRSNFLVPFNELIREGILSKMYLKHKAEVPWLQFEAEKVILPDLESLFEVCGELIFIPTVDRRERIFWKCYRIELGKVEIITEALEAVKSEWRSYAVTPDEKARLASVQKICSLMGTIKLNNPADMSIPGLVTYDDESGTYIPLEGYIKGYIK